MKGEIITRVVGEEAQQRRPLLVPVSRNKQKIHYDCEGSNVNMVLSIDHSIGFLLNISAEHLVKFNIICKMLLLLLREIDNTVNIKLKINY